MKKVLVTDIQRYAVNDGPGFRTNVFLKGCPLACKWCHNPETIAAFPEIYWKNRLCVQCGACLEVCPVDAINPPIPPEESQLENSSYHKIIRDRCDRCLKCVDACKYGALEIAGNEMSVEDIIEEVLKDSMFYSNSGGGLTLSGGEPTAHAEFSESILKSAKDRGLHVCLDTNGFAKWEVLEKLAGYADIILFDLKHVDSGKHMEMTGVGNELIKENLDKLTVLGKDIWIRVPVIPEFNDSIDYHKKAAEFLDGLTGKITRVDLLPFHDWCQDKYRWLGIKWPLAHLESLDATFLEIPAEIYREKGFETTVGGSGFEEQGGQ